MSTDLYAYSRPVGQPDEDMTHAFIHRGVFWMLTSDRRSQLADGVVERTVAEYESALDAAKADGMRRGWADHREDVPTIPLRFSDRVKLLSTHVGSDMARLLPR